VNEPRTTAYSRLWWRIAARSKLGNFCQLLGLRLPCDGGDLDIRAVDHHVSEVDVKWQTWLCRDDGVLCCLAFFLAVADEVSTFCGTAVFPLSATDKVGRYSVALSRRIGNPVGTLHGGAACMLGEVAAARRYCEVTGAASAPPPRSISTHLLSALPVRHSLVGDVLVSVNGESANPSRSSGGESRACVAGGGVGSCDRPEWAMVVIGGGGGGGALLGSGGRGHHRP
jgi:hypothetical protein